MVIERVIQMINIGVIGCGKIAQVRHLPEYADNRNVNIAAVFDLDRYRAGKMAADYGAKAYSSWRELLDNPE